MTISFLGLGAMGARMAGRLVAAGHDVTVWNRSDGETPAGAARAASPAEAASGADLVFSMVRDAAASRDVWTGSDGALAALKPGAVGVECSTLSLPFVRELAGAFADRGRGFLDAPVAGSRPQAEAGALIFLVGGEDPDLAAARPALEAMSGAIHHAGPAGSGALVKLMVNALFGAQVAALAELIGLARRAGGDGPRAVEILCATPVAAPALQAAGPAMLGEAFPPAFPIDLVAKDFRLLTESAREAGARLPLGEATRAVYEAAAREGYAEDNITGVVQRY